MSSFFHELNICRRLNASFMIVRRSCCISTGAYAMCAYLTPDSPGAVFFCFARMYGSYSSQVTASIISPYMLVFICLPERFDIFTLAAWNTLLNTIGSPQWLASFCSVSYCSFFLVSLPESVSASVGWSVVFADLDMNHLDRPSPIHSSITAVSLSFISVGSVIIRGAPVCLSLTISSVPELDAPPPRMRRMNRLILLSSYSLSRFCTPSDICSRCSFLHVVVVSLHCLSAFLVRVSIHIAHFSLVSAAGSSISFTGILFQVL